MKISLYIHIPFCIKKCLYCDFLSGPSNREVQISYIAALLKEIRMRSHQFKEYEVKSIFFGGGTPSVLPGADIKSIMDEVRKDYVLASDCEISVEVNPGCEDMEGKFRIYKECGINRISIGLQSASDEELRILGRVHTRKDFEDTYRLAVTNGFENLNVDLISGIPGQSAEGFKLSLDYLLNLNPAPKHISAYSLIVEEGTPFEKMYGDGGTACDMLPSEDEERLMYEITDDILSSKGYKHYEISNYALPGSECYHNCVYWKRGDYLGLGLGASGMVDNVRYRNTDDVEKYIEVLNMSDMEECIKTSTDADTGACVEISSDSDMGECDKILSTDVKALSLKEQMEEFMFLGLRMMDGVSISEFEANFGVTLPKQYVEVIDKYIRLGMLERQNNRVMLTKEGINVSNVIMADFLFDE